MGLSASARDELDPVLQSPAWRARSSISPSSASRLLSCGLKAAFDSAPKPPAAGLKSPPALLGTICHDTLDDAARHLFGPADDEAQWREAFEATWDRRLKEASSHCAIPTDRWPGLNKRKVATRRLALAVTKEADQGAVFLPEEELTLPGGELKGRADLVVRSPVHEIRDYKTGPVLDSNDNPRDEYVRQLLLYAVMEAAVFGSWPESVVLVPFRGPEIRMQADIRRAEAERAAQAAIEALHEYNGAIAKDADPEGIASPSPSACRYCDYAPHCAPFWGTADAQWADEGLVAVAGRLSEIRVAQNGGVSLEIQTTAGTLESTAVIITPVDPAEFPGVTEIPAGAIVGATELRPHGPGYARTGTATRMAWSS